MHNLEFIEKTIFQLKNSRLPTKVILNKLRIMAIDIKASYFIADPYYLPFYYYLGKNLESKNVLQFGFEKGYIAGAFVLGCNTVQNLLSLEEEHKEFYSPQFGINTLRSIYSGNKSIHVGNINNENYLTNLKQGLWDTVLVSSTVSYDQYMMYLKTIWSYLDNNSLIFIDRVNDHADAKKAMYDFAKIKNRNAFEMFSKFGTGLIVK